MFLLKISHSYIFYIFQFLIFSVNEYPREAKVLLVRVVAYSNLGTTNPSDLINVTVRNDTGHLSQKYRRDRAIISGKNCGGDGLSIQSWFTVQSIPRML